MVLLAERDGGEGPYVEGAKERFWRHASGETFKTVRWSSTAGISGGQRRELSVDAASKGTASLSVSVETARKDGEGLLTST